MAGYSPETDFSSESHSTATFGVAAPALGLLDSSQSAGASEQMSTDSEMTNTPQRRPREESIADPRSRSKSPRRQEGLPCGRGASDGMHRSGIAASSSAASSSEVGQPLSGDFTSLRARLFRTRGDAFSNAMERSVALPSIAEAHGSGRNVAEGAASASPVRILGDVRPALSKNPFQLQGEPRLDILAPAAALGQPAQSGAGALRDQFDQNNALVDGAGHQIAAPLAIEFAQAPQPAVQQPNHVQPHRVLAVGDLPRPVNVPVTIPPDPAVGHQGNQGGADGQSDYDENGRRVRVTVSREQLEGFLLRVRQCWGRAYQFGRGDAIEEYRPHFVALENFA